MLLRDVPPLLREEPAFASVLGRSSAVLAVPEPARALVVAGLATASSRRPIVAAVPTTGDADRLAADLRTYLGADAVDTFPAWETLPFERVSPSVETMGRRLRTMWRLRDPDRAPRVLVAPVRALVQRLGPHVEDVEPVVVRPGERRDRDELLSALVRAGYRREEVVEHRGHVAVRGSIVDVFPSTADRPVRIDLWGDEVDRLTEFSVADQRSTEALEHVELFGCRELLPTDEVRARADKLVALEPWGREQWERLAQGLTFDGMESWLPWLTEGEHVLFDLVHRDALVLLVEPRRMRDRAADLLAEEADLAATLAKTWGATSGDDASGGHGFPRLHLPFDRLLAHTDAPAWTITTAPEGPDVATVASMGVAATAGDPERVVRQLAELAGEGYRIVVAADGEGSAARLRQLLGAHGLAPTIDIAPLERGCILPAVKLAVVAEHDLTGRRRAHRKARTRRRDSQGFFDDLKAGDYVVHHQHGVARYGGMVQRAIGGVERDYLLLEYRGDDRLYVPSDQIDAVRHYTGGEAPTLTRLGGDGWQKAKARVRSAVAEIAQELVVLYQTRLNARGHAFPEDTPWQRELEEAFPYQETPDQATAITEVKADMEADHPMDRLVCGDVGFGKTEVAIRGAFKAVQDGKQVAVLVPTTLLAQQHHQTFSDRFAGYPVRVEVLSRFLTAAQAKAVVAAVRSGEVDIVIGTHRLLSDDVEFKDLGLLVVDEEQRFGVTHKEQIKQLKTGVDVLTLSATPIPRTLEMSLTGIRDLTLLNTPPADRMPILTYVGEYDDRAVAEAIRRELLREGQVFYVHNRVQDIERTAEHVRDLVPEARVAIAHGQMDEGTLEQVVLAFWEGEYDVLVCTTIIESGIDMPTVNTLVVDRADLLGLGQLHQLRGRVGRSGQRAYAYLFVPQDRVLSEDAYERLKTIGEATELGSGFKIAMRDLEIRGAGNLLGTGQSGHIAAVGYDLYCQMVTEAVAELKGEPVREPAEIKLDLPLAANLPRDYVAKEELRLEAYRRLAAVTTDAEVDDIQAEWEDRYGPPPKEAVALLAVARLRAEAARTGVREITVVKPSGFGGAPSTARLSPIPLKASQQVRLKRLHPTAVYKEPEQLLVAKVPAKEHPAGWLVDLLRELDPV
ncbi:MAG: transcription-repair coupling factor [Acidimicrobiales bacterium]